MIKHYRISSHKKSIMKIHSISLSDLLAQGSSWGTTWARLQLHSGSRWAFDYHPGKRTIQPGLKLVPSGNFFLALNRSHHFFVKKSQNLIGRLELNDSILIILHCWKIMRIDSKVTKFESLFLSFLIKFLLFRKKNNDLYLKSQKKFPDGTSLRHW